MLCEWEEAVNGKDLLNKKNTIVETYRRVLYCIWNDFTIAAADKGPRKGQAQKINTTGLKVF